MNPFVAAGMIENSKFFVGRQDELHAIVSRLNGDQPTSINVVGEKRIGKSSLLKHFCQTWEARVSDPSRYVVIYLSLQNGQCHKEENFYQAVARELLNLPRVANVPALNQPLQVQPFNRMAFTDAMKKWEHQKVLPVLCLDNFKTLFDHKSEFDNDFYNNLRSLMDDNCLMLVIATTKTLDFYARKYQLTSDFFNLGHVLRLGELNDDEVTDLVRLPASTVNGATPALSMDEQKLARELGGKHPFLLQMAGGLAWEARQQGRDAKWAKIKFEEERRRLPRAKFGSRRWWRRVGHWTWNAPLYVGRVTTSLGRNIDDAANRMVGIAIIVMVLLVFAGVLPWNQVWEFVRDKLGIK